MFYSVNIKVENYKDGKWEQELFLSARTFFVFALNDEEAINKIDECIKHHSNEKTRIIKDGKIVKGYGLLQSNVFGNCEISLF